MAAYGWRGGDAAGTARIVGSHGDYYKAVCDEAAGPVVARRKKSVFVGKDTKLRTVAAGRANVERRPAGDDDGSRVQVVIRSDSDGGWPLDLAVRLMALLDEARDVCFVPGGHYVNRVETERGFEYGGSAQNDAQFYAASFRIYCCG